MARIMIAEISKTTEIQVKIEPLLLTRTINTPYLIEPGSTGSGAVTATQQPDHRGMSAHSPRLQPEGASSPISSFEVYHESGFVLESLHKLTSWKRKRDAAIATYLSLSS
jgi:hypothetical protein